MTTPHITELLSAWSDGDKAALEQLMPMVYRELRRLAGRHLGHERVGHTLQATALVNEGWQPVVDTLAELFVPETYPAAVPELWVDRTRYCVGDPWILLANGVAPLSAVQISGIWDGTPWTIPNWTTSVEDGTVVASGTFGADTVGDYWVWLHAGGNVSNTVSIHIEDCIDGFRR
jgi:ECF sigma factor